MIEIKNIYKTFGERTILRDLSFKINEGESIILDIVSDRTGAFYYASSGSNIDNNDIGL